VGAMFVAGLFYRDPFAVVKCVSGRACRRA
jgi:hypothetical protein